METPSLYDIPVVRLDGTPTTLAPYRGQVMLIVNVASHCGFTPQYAGLEELYRRYKDRGFVVLGFPCNQFLWQEPGSAEDIQNFCTTKYNVTFPLFAKIDVNGPNTHPLYRYLKTAAPGSLGTTSIKWNFTKFLVDRQGNVVARYGSSTKPERLAPEIESLLAKAAA
ncbi:MAG: glutathione peroxidase [Gemmataceae bacterium]|nr:glutathione peroxidase [Gemmata sp.]MDW8198694.1 glutathione peroxidase [Gemmataceae bacterium]